MDIQKNYQNDGVDSSLNIVKLKTENQELKNQVRQLRDILEKTKKDLELASATLNHVDECINRKRL